ncbi:hypothetical protein [Dyadobacter sediminis]|uniref:hypothetical protein n=1 Tax=Dyadobacter sediminis TaxID=1493691 RepID=UPI00148638A7|nr:hypothetical protein [Dyadobacter sediminis]GGB85846.1 hypothetical protein GCM10011325_11830 [Dyadobacter sediminis]
MYRTAVLCVEFEQHTNKKCPPILAGIRFSYLKPDLYLNYFGVVVVAGVDDPGTVEGDVTVLPGLVDGLVVPGVVDGWVVELLGTLPGCVELPGMVLDGCVVLPGTVDGDVVLPGTVVD